MISEKIKTNTGAYAYLPTITENDTMIKILNKYLDKLDDINTEDRKLYEEFLEKPGSHKSHELLHTTYVAREKYRNI